MYSVADFPPLYVKASCADIVSYSLEAWKALHKICPLGAFHLTSFNENINNALSLTEKLELPLIIEKDALSVKKTKTGGLCVDISKEKMIPAYSISKIRKQLGTGPVLGIDCGASRDHAMQAGEEGSDYIVFSTETEKGLEEIAKHIGWWATYTTIPCVASGPIGKKHLSLFLKADFINLPFSYVKENLEQYS